jgi:hypothetical protein
MWIEDALVACITVLSRSAVTLGVASFPVGVQNAAGVAVNPTAELGAPCGSRALRGMFEPLRAALCAVNLAPNVAQKWLPKPHSRRPVAPPERYLTMPLSVQNWQQHTHPLLFNGSPQVMFAAVDITPSALYDGDTAVADTCLTRCTTPVVRALCDGTAVSADAFFSGVVAPVVSVGVCLLVIMLTMPLLLISISAVWAATMCFALYMAALGISIVAAHGVRHADRPQSPEDEWSVRDGRTWTDDGTGSSLSSCALRSRGDDSCPQMPSAAMYKAKHMVAAQTAEMLMSRSGMVSMITNRQAPTLTTGATTQEKNASAATTVPSQSDLTTGVVHRVSHVSTTAAALS